MDNLISRLFSSVSEFFRGLATTEGIFNYLLLGSVGLLILVLLYALIRSNTTYEVKLLRTLNSLNKYFLKEPYVNDENLIRFNRKMKNVPKTLRYHWQEFMLNRDKAPSEYMNATNCVDQPSKASGYNNLANSIGIYTVIIAVLTFLLGSASYYSDLTARFNVVYYEIWLLPVLILTLGFLAVAFFKARYTSIVTDVYYQFHEFERNINKACTTLPQFIDYEVLFTKREIREGIPVLQEYLEKRALQEKLEQEEAQLNQLKYEEFDFSDLGVENSLLLDRAMLESEKFFKVKNDLSLKIKSKEEEMQNYQKSFDEVTKDYERKAQVSRETLSQLTDQINNTTIKIEANYMKKRYNEELQRSQQLEKEYEIARTRFEKQQAEFEEEVEEYRGEIQRRKKILQDAMSAEGRTYAKKVYTMITNDVQEQSRPYLEQVEQNRIELEESVATLTHELEFKNNELNQLNANLEKITQEYQVKLAGLEHVKALKDYLQSKEFIAGLASAKKREKFGDEELQKELSNAENKISQLSDELNAKESELRQVKAAKEELEEKVNIVFKENNELKQQIDRLSGEGASIKPLTIPLVENNLKEVLAEEEPKDEVKVVAKEVVNEPVKEIKNVNKEKVEKKSKPKKVEKVLAKNSLETTKSEIDELTNLKERIEAESKNLAKQQNELKTTIEKTITTLEEEPVIVVEEVKEEQPKQKLKLNLDALDNSLENKDSNKKDVESKKAQKPTPTKVEEKKDKEEKVQATPIETVKPAGLPLRKNKIGQSLNDLLAAADKIDKKKKQ